MWCLEIQETPSRPHHELSGFLPLAASASCPHCPVHPFSVFTPFVLASRCIPRIQDAWLFVSRVYSLFDHQFSETLAFWLSDKCVVQRLGPFLIIGLIHSHWNIVYFARRGHYLRKTVPRFTVSLVLLLLLTTSMPCRTLICLLFTGWATMLGL